MFEFSQENLLTKLERTTKIPIKKITFFIQFSKLLGQYGLLTKM